MFPSVGPYSARITSVQPEFMQALKRSVLQRNGVRAVAIEHCTCRCNRWGWKFVLLAKFSAFLQSNSVTLYMWVLSKIRAALLSCGFYNRSVQVTLYRGDLQSWSVVLLHVALLITWSHCLLLFPAAAGLLACLAMGVKVSGVWKSGMLDFQ